MNLRELGAKLQKQGNGITRGYHWQPAVENSRGNGPFEKTTKNKYGQIQHIWTKILVGQTRSTTNCGNIIGKHFYREGTCTNKIWHDFEKSANHHRISLGTRYAKFPQFGPSLPTAHCYDWNCPSTFRRTTRGYATKPDLKKRQRQRQRTKVQNKQLVTYNTQ